MLVGKLALGAAAVPLAIGGLVGGSAQVDAYHNGEKSEIHAELREAIQNNDYDSWYEIVTSNEHNPFSEHADKEVFSTLQDIHTLHQQGDKETAREAKQELAESLGIELKQHKRGKHRKHHRLDLSQEAREELREAVDSGDYNVWLEVAEQYLPEKKIQNMTEEKFLEMVERHANREVQFNR